MRKRRDTDYMAKICGRLAAAFVLAVGLSSSASAAIVACSTNPNLGSFTVGDSNSGCSTVDYQFHTFSFTSAEGDTIGGIPIPTATFTPAISSIFISPLGSDPGLVTLSAPGPSFPDGDNPNTPDQNYCGPNSGDGGWCVQGANEALVSTVTYIMDSLGAPIQFIGFTGIIWSHNSGSGTGASALAFREVCVGGAFFGNNSGSCPDGRYAVLQGGQIQGGFNDLAFNVVVGLNPSADPIYIRDTILLVTNNGTGAWASLVNLDLIDTPEPSTFGLMSLALGGLALFRVRRRRKA